MTIKQRVEQLLDAGIGVSGTPDEQLLTTVLEAVELQGKINALEEMCTSLRHDPDEPTLEERAQDKTEPECYGYCHQAKDGETFTCSCPCCK